ncbi:hypothetical protein [Rhodoflexus caldus]|uniref:hypothetical protein n=1 Tax=Rhodoflexus caldus TaxID=2891236 RepID=UPI00202A609C|nr:hypothetical protein [Rhodoflexus caldus]
MKNKLTLFLFALLLWNCKGKTSTDESDGTTTAEESVATADYSSLENLIGTYPLDDMDGDGKPETIVLYGQPQDAGVFTQIRIDYSNAGSMAHTYAEGYDKISEPERFTRLTQSDVIVSNVFGGKECPYLLRLQHKGTKNAFLIIEGYGYANESRLTVLDLVPQEGESVMLDEHFVLNDILLEKSLPGYNQPAFVLIGKKSLDELLGQNEDGSYSMTYCPHLTVPLAPVGNDAKMAYMKAYNEKHYLWDGPECNERIVFFPANGKPYFQ